MTAAEVSALLAAKYAAPAHAYLPQVRNGTGYSRAMTRTADALAMSLWPSRGLLLHGFEIKVSRSDWLAELKDPSKAEAICQFCDRWWLVASDESIVQKGELPPTWGLYVVKGKKLVTVTEAPLFTAKAMDRPMLAAILRKHTESTVPTSEVSPKIAAARDEGYERGKREMDHRDHYKRCHEELVESVKAFEAATGLSVFGQQRYTLPKLGAAVKFVMERQGHDWPSDADHLAECLERAAKKARELASDFAEEFGEPQPAQETL